MASNNTEIKEDKKPETAAPAEKKSGQAVQSADEKKKKRALVVYLSIIFAAAFLLVAISLIVRIQTMKEDFSEANSQADVSYAALENQVQELEDRIQAAETNARAAECLTLAQNAYYKEDIPGFHEYMKELEQVSDGLSQDMMNIYEHLKTIEGELK